MENIKGSKENGDAPVLSIDTDTNYWFIRANGGKFYTDFLENNFIGISDNKIKTLDIGREKDSKSVISVENIKDIYTDKYPEYNAQKTTLYSKRLYSFAYDMKIGDIVLVPSKSSISFLVGIVSSNLYDGNITIDDEKQFNYSKCNYIKRREVIWIKEINRDELPQKMFWVLSAHQSFFNVTEYANRINDVISPLYRYGDQYHTNIFVDMDNELSIKDWNQITTQLIEQLNDDMNKINMEAEIHSPGWLNFICTTDPMLLKSLLNSLVHMIDTHQTFIITGTSGVGTTWLLNTVIKIIGGKKIKEEGIIEWIQNRNSQHMDNKLKKIELVEKEKTINASLQFKDNGHQIENKTPKIDDLSSGSQKKELNEDNSD